MLTNPASVRCLELVETSLQPHKLVIYYPHRYFLFFIHACLRVERSFIPHVTSGRRYVLNVEQKATRNALCRFIVCLAVQQVTCVCIIIIINHHHHRRRRYHHHHDQQQ